ncbi:prealbumin-like fold domain-containing protein [Enterococcus larvae]|uniref:prealbumin-like fold domain-containing protein n=1 Tax=Enterococcus larvae TaxID=2794352 RepID=UPI003F2FE06F
MPIIIRKINETGLSLAGARFRILDKNKNVVLDNLISDSNGLTNYFNLSPGIYFIEEIEAPDGHIRLNKLIQFEIIG